MRAILTTLGEVIGAASVAVGAGLAWLPAGFIVGGALFAIGAFLAADEGES